jgi:predicted transport protein
VDNYKHKDLGKQELISLLDEKIRIEKFLRGEVKELRFFISNNCLPLHKRLRLFLTRLKGKLSKFKTFLPVKSKDGHKIEIKGEIENIGIAENGDYELNIKNSEGVSVSQKISKTYELRVTKGSKIDVNQSLTKDPNVGGFGQTETEIVLQSPARVKGMIAFFFTIILAQILLVLKKKQFEKVQLAEMNF